MLYLRGVREKSPRLCLRSRKSRYHTTAGTCAQKREPKKVGLSELLPSKPDELTAGAPTGGSGRHERDED